MSYQGATSFAKFAWWEKLLFQRPIREFSTCAGCGTVNNSIDVVCVTDNSVLVGVEISAKDQARLINFLRAMAVGVALAVGYLSLLWPVYVFVGLAMIAFFSLFLRNHSSTWYFFLTISILSYLGYGIWNIIDPKTPPLFYAIGLTFSGLLVLVLLFLVIYTLRTSTDDPRHQWMLQRNIDLHLGTVVWISLMLTSTILFLVGASMYRAIPQFFHLFISERNLDILFLQGAVLALGTGEITALVASTVYSLRAQAFDVQDKWIYRPIAHDKSFERLPVVRRPTIMTWINRFSSTVQRIVTASANRLIDGIENAYNNFYVRFINNLAQTAIRIANTIRKVIIKTALHIARSLTRFWVLNRWCFTWSWHVMTQHVQVFVVPAMLCFICALLTLNIGADFFSYVHGGIWYTPLVLLAKSIGLLMLFSIATGLLSHLNLFSFFEKVLNALSIFGTSAFLFFVLSAWLLGIAGMLTEGPYRVGWVTILSTLTLLLVFGIAQRRATKSMRDETGGTA